MKYCRVKKVVLRTPKYIMNTKEIISVTKTFSGEVEFHEEIGKLSQTGNITKTRQSIVKKMVRRQKNKLKKRDKTRIKVVNDNIKIANEKASIKEDFHKKQATNNHFMSWIYTK